MGQINRVKLRGCGLRMRGLASLLRLRRLSCLPLERKHGGCLQPTKMAALANSQLLQISRRGMATGQRLVVSIDGKEEEFPWVWLRDNCQCTQCYEAISRCRIHNPTEWEIGVKPSKVEVDQGAVKVGPPMGDQKALINSKGRGGTSVSGGLGGRPLFKFSSGLAQREKLSRGGKSCLQGEGGYTTRSLGLRACR